MSLGIFWFRWVCDFFVDFCRVTIVTVQNVLLIYLGDMKEHWEKVYKTKEDNEVSWFQEKPFESLSLITKHQQNQNEAIIDVGGGNSNLIFELDLLRYSNLSVLDISRNALNRSKSKDYQGDVGFIESNILDFLSSNKFSVWHDRAVFHFLVNDEDKAKYLEILKANLNDNGVFVLATFSKSGPEKCSGLEISRYDINELLTVFGNDFTLLDSFQKDHETPFFTLQSFIYSVWRKK